MDCGRTIIWMRMGFVMDLDSSLNMVGIHKTRLVSTPLPPSRIITAIFWAISNTVKVIMDATNVFPIVCTMFLTDLIASVLCILVWCLFDRAEVFCSILLTEYCSIISPWMVWWSVPVMATSFKSTLIQCILGSTHYVHLLYRQIDQMSVIQMA